MTRTISNSLSGILQELELNRPLLVTIEQLNEIKNKYNVLSSAEMVAARLREKGWFNATGRQGVWEFIPADSAGFYPSNDPLLEFHAFYAKYPTAKCALTLQSAAWIYGIANRTPAKTYIALEDLVYSRTLKGHAITSIFKPNLPYNYISNIPVLAQESIIVQMTTKPSVVKFWTSVYEWLPELCIDLSLDRINDELKNRSPYVSQRLAYLIQNLRPDIASELYNKNKPTSNTWFGARTKTLRYDSHFMVADSLLPFDPRRI